MNDKQNYTQKLDEIRSMMERSSRFLSLSGWAGIMAGLYALAGAYIAYAVFGFDPDGIDYVIPSPGRVILLGLVVLAAALVTAVLFSRKKAADKGEKIWNSVSRRLLAQMGVPLVSGGILITVFIIKGLGGLILPLTLLFYGLALYNAGKFTIDAVKFLGFAQILLGLLSSYFIEYSLIFWAAGFGGAHIVYGIYMFARYER